MNSNLLIYYLFRLIKDGHEWQYKNLNGKGEKPKFFFSFLQFIALCVSCIFCLYKPTGLTSNATDHILTCLSIMVALFLSLIIVIFDKSKQVKAPQSIGKADEVIDSIHPVKELHLWNFYYQFNALTSYAILLSISVIMLILIGLLFDMEMDISKYDFISYKLWDKASISTFIRGFFIVSMRFCIVYFLLDFFIVCLYAICTIYQYIRLDFLEKRPDIQVYNEEDVSSTFKREYGINIKTIRLSVIIILLIIFSSIVYGFV